MLTKQGLFKRGTESTPGSFSVSPTASAMNSAKPMSPSSIHNQPIASASATPSPQVATELKPEMALNPGPPSDSRLIVGPDVKLKGAEILDCDTLVVEGRVEATMDSRVIQIAAAGSFSGKVGIDVAEVHGCFDGELTARSQLIIHSTGRVSGKIRYGKILIEEGGELSGDVASLTVESAKANNLHIARINMATET
jgi:cytoskeletal protein CcmA (bactofilin family)